VCGVAQAAVRPVVSYIEPFRLGPQKRNFASGRIAESGVQFPPGPQSFSAGREKGAVFLVKVLFKMRSGAHPRTFSFNALLICDKFILSAAFGSALMFVLNCLGKGAGSTPL